MPKIKVWDKKAMKVGSEREIPPDKIHAIERYTIRTPRGPSDGCSITLKNDQGGAGEKLRINQNYNEVCRLFGWEAKGASGIQPKPSTLPGRLTPSATPGSD